MRFSGMTKDEQARLILQCRDDSELLGKVIEANSDLIWHTVHKYLGQTALITSKYGVENDDIYQMGCLGFIKAIRRFELTSGYAFSTFACPTIYREIKDFLRDKGGIIRPSRTAQSILYQIQKLDNAWVTMTDEQIATAIDCPVNEVHRLRQTQSIQMLGEHSDELTANGPAIEEIVLEEIDAEHMLDEIERKLNYKERQVFGYLKMGYEPKAIRDVMEDDIDQIIFNIQSMVHDLGFVNSEEQYAGLVEQTKQLLEEKPRSTIRAISKHLGVSEMLAIYLYRKAKSPE